ncbi:MAG: class I SAM-dependent methyltransferase [Methanotrichaceae archaeon]|nr:class I SAM-dependent methyltransferase [Methanotrichaceae archaeon]
MISKEFLSRLIKNPWQEIRFQTILRALPLLIKDPQAQRINLWNSFGRLPRVPLIQLFPEVKEIDLTILHPYNRIINTSIDLEELVVILAILKAINARKVLEIGTFDGNTTINIAANTLNDSQIITVDLPLDWNGHYRILTPESYVNASDRALIGKQFFGTIFAKKITQIFGDSAELDWAMLGGPFDMIFIDGNHYYRYVKHDTENALKHLEPSGVIVWHDYGNMIDVSRVVDEVSLKMPVHVISGTRVAIGQLIAKD